MFTFKSIDIYVSAPLLKSKERSKEMIRVFIKKNKVVLNYFFFPEEQKSVYSVAVFSVLKDPK